LCNQGLKGRTWETLYRHNRSLRCLELEYPRNEWTELSKSLLWSGMISGVTRSPVIFLKLPYWHRKRFRDQEVTSTPGT
jgi:hypothetical protein